MWPVCLSGFPPLLAQQAVADVAVYGGPPAAALVLLVGLVLAVPLVAIVLGIRQARATRELEHTERMKALEMGRTLPQDLPAVFWTPGKIAAGMGILLPLAAFQVAFLMSTREPNLGQSAWVAACLVSICSVVCATALMFRFGHAAAAPAAPSTGLKPTADDPDLYDTAGQRAWSHGPDPLVSRP